MPNCNTIAICNQKGGVGKTTTTVNLGVGLAMQGKKVLLVDADPQGDLTTCLGWQDTDNLPVALPDKMVEVMQDKCKEPMKGILHHKEGVDLIPSNSDLFDFEISLVTAMNREAILRNYLNEVKHNYDYIIIDCSPSLGMMTLNALSAADKVDKEYPDNKLSGATFEVYKDNNADGKLDDGDTLIGTLTESEVGIYEMKDMRYGHYLIKETVAPDGFFLDEGVYAVFIENDGTTYVVENEAGVGFINNAMTGTLKIVKTSSDGKVEGFSFRITGPNGFDVTLKTDKNGEIFLEGLRIGEYTVSEIADDVSAPYSRPADKKANVMTDSTTIVEMHNVFIDNPKTGDDSNIGLWLGLLGLSVVGIGATVFFGFKRKKKDGEQ